MPFFDLQRCRGIKNVYMEMCLPQMTVHAGVFPPYCQGRKLSDHFHMWAATHWQAVATGTEVMHGTNTSHEI